MGVGGRGRLWGFRVDVIEELKFLGKLRKKSGWGFGRGQVGGGGGQGGYERRIEVFGKIQKKRNGDGVGGSGSGGVGLGGRVGGDVNEELKVLGKFTQKNRGWGVRREGGQVGVGLVGGGQCGCERNVGVGGDVGYGGCEPRIEGIVQCTKRYCTILRK